jgi:hypothetical protein
LTTQLAEMKEILEDSRKTSIRLVVNPEKMVIKEAQRAYTFFSLFGYSLDLVIVNRIIPEKVEDPYFEKWKAIQENYLCRIEEMFSPIPIKSSELYTQEIVGIKLLEKAGREFIRTPTRPSSSSTRNRSESRRPTEDTSCRFTCPLLRRASSMSPRRERSFSSRRVPSSGISSSPASCSIIASRERNSTRTA